MAIKEAAFNISQLLFNISFSQAKGKALNAILLCCHTLTDFAALYTLRLLASYICRISLAVWYAQKGKGCLLIHDAHKSGRTHCNDTHRKLKGNANRIANNPLLANGSQY